MFIMHLNIISNQDNLIITVTVLTMIMIFDYILIENHPDLLDRLKYTKEAYLSEADIAKAFRVDRVLVGRGIYVSTVEGQTSTKSYIYFHNKKNYILHLKLI